MNYGFNYGLFGSGGVVGLAVFIKQTFAGSCNLDVADPCIAISTHVAEVYNGEGTVSYLWSADNGAIIATGQGTATVEVSSDGGSDSTFNLTCEVTDDVATANKSVPVNHDRYVPFDGGLFVNGGFEEGLTGWSEFGDWTASPDKQQAENPGISSSQQIIYQNFTLAADGVYQISADKLEGDGQLTFMVNDVDSGAAVEAGPHIFAGEAVARSTGLFVSTAGNNKIAIDNMKLIRLDLACAGSTICMVVEANPNVPSMFGFSLNENYGTVRPTAYLDIPIHSITFDRDTGACLVRMGPDGITLIPGYDEMAWEFSGFTGEIDFVWDAVEFRYEAVNLALAQYVETQDGEYMGLLFKPVTFDPLEDSPDWQFIQGDNAESYMYSLGRDIYKISTGSGQENFVAFKPFEVWNDSEISCIVLQDGVSQLNSLFAMVVRGVDINNFVGMRFYANYLDVYERKGGVFKSLNQNPVPMSEVGTNKVTLRVEGRVVTVLINDVERGDYVDCDALDTLLAGYCGIVERPSQAIAIAHSYSCVERKIGYVGGNATGTLTYLAFDREPSGLPTSVTINAGGVDLTTTLVEQSGSQLVVTTAETVVSGQTVLCTIDDTGSNVPQLTNSFVNNNTSWVTYGNELVTYNGEQVTYEETP